MQQSDSGNLETVTARVSELEVLCNDIELSLRTNDWDRLQAVLCDVRRAMHAFENAMAETAHERDDEFDRVVFARLQHVYAVRDEQVKRLRAIHEGIGERLRAISRWKQYARAVGTRDAGKPARLFSDVR